MGHKSQEAAFASETARSQQMFLLGISPCKFMIRGSVSGTARKREN